MPKLTIPLTDAKIQAAVPRDNPYKLGDSGGLYLYVKPSGACHWHMKYRHLGKERRLSLGAYPGVSLVMARAARDRVHQLLADGQDPAEVLREERALARETQPAGRTFHLALNEAGELTINQPRSRMRLNTAQVAALRAFLDATNDGGNTQGE
jgi:Arm DNA-binding domain